MDGLTFYKLMRILAGELVKSKLNLMAVAGGSVYLSFYKDGRLNLCFRAAPTPPALFKSEEVAGDSHGAMGALAGASVSDISAFGYERSGFIELKKRKPSGKLLTYKIVLEPAGNYANCLLLDDDGVILYSLSSRTIDPDRNIGAGSKYCLPKPNKRFSLDNCSGAASFADLAGFYPLTAKYADKLLLDNSFEEAAQIIKESLHKDDYFYVDKNSKLVPFAIDDYKDKITWANIGDYFKEKDKPKDMSEALTAEKIAKYFEKSMDKYLRLAQKLETQLFEAKDYDKLYNEAELIKNNIHKVAGAGEYTFEQYTATGVEEKVYNVSYGEDLKEKGDKLFKKALRLKKSVPIIEGRLEETLQMALSAEEQVFYAKNISDNNELYAFEKLISKGKKPKPQKDKKSSERPFYEYSGDGFNLYAGRSSFSNHFLVFKYALDSDLWFHGRNYPSAHVILRPHGGQEVTGEMIEFASKVAAALSKMKNEKKAEVDYTFRKYVDNPKNTPPGFVIYKRFKTITIEPFRAEVMEKLFSTI